MFLGVMSLKTVMFSCIINVCADILSSYCRCDEFLFIYAILVCLLHSFKHSNLYNKEVFYGIMLQSSKNMICLVLKVFRTWPVAFVTVKELQETLKVEFYYLCVIVYAKILQLNIIFYMSNTMYRIKIYSCAKVNIK